MSPSINVQRRRLLLGGATLAGAGALLGWTQWVPARALAVEAPEPAGPVTLVVFDDHGRRLGQRTQARVIKTTAQWQAALTPAQYYILREQGTEPAFSGKYVNKPKQPGFYRCQGCGNALYDAATQFHSGTGWPSFWQPIAAINVTEHIDSRYGMTRTEIHCTLCDGHLGHKFHDGPPPTDLRYCMDSLALRFVPTDAA
ncbi:MAG: peptide-methionine (R)-S-oxide reductase [Rhodanobacteraceae bacterium]|nr:MAG: peptide-methionine (R)-S-oxide reductase [Rhodanobacteraceae bacterium]